MERAVRRRRRWAATISRCEEDAPSGKPGDLSLRYGSTLQHQARRLVGGYKVHLTESCDGDAPRLITNVETTPATTPDDNMIEVVHRSLESRNLLPCEHLVDKGYTDAKVLVASQREYGVEIIGPVAQDPSWQSRDSAGFDKSAFVIDWEAKVVTSPAGKQSISWLPNTYPANGTAFEARFARRDCTPCPSRSQCTRSKQEPRIIGLQTREHHEALQA